MISYISILVYFSDKSFICMNCYKFLTEIAEQTSGQMFFELFKKIPTAIVSNNSMNFTLNRFVSYPPNVPAVSSP